MKKLLVLLVLATLVISCKSRKIAVSKTSTDSVEVSGYLKVYQDSSRTIRVEKVDTTISIPGYIVYKDFQLKPFTDQSFPGFAEVLADLDTGMVKLQLQYDAINNRLKVVVTARDQLKKILIDKITTINNRISEVTTGKKHVSVQKEASTKHIEAKPFPWLAVACTVLLVLISVVLYLLYRSRRYA